MGDFLEVLICIMMKEWIPVVVAVLVIVIMYLFIRIMEMAEEDRERRERAKLKAIQETRRKRAEQMRQNTELKAYKPRTVSHNNGSSNIINKR